ncbi:MAG: sulfurtransferase TusA family protein [Armatimonadetes bacterium]|nr:sulfurtransferase TusA family protein [Armatimonadota bacterium]
MLLDVRGETCPYPMQKVMDALETLPKGEELEVLLDHPPAIETIKWLAARRGFAVEVETIGSSEWRLRLRRREEVVA